jgi:hypothetical protein
MFNKAWEGAIALADTWLENQDNILSIDVLGDNKALIKIWDNDRVIASFEGTFLIAREDTPIIDFFFFIEKASGNSWESIQGDVHSLRLITVNFAGCEREDTPGRQGQWIDLIFEALKPWLLGLNEAVKPKKVSLPTKVYAETGVGL